MTLPPYTRIREGETRQLGEWSELPPGWADFSGLVLYMAKPETNKELQNI